MRKPLGIPSALLASALALCARSVLAGDAGSEGAVAQEAGTTEAGTDDAETTEASSPDEAGSSEGGPVTVPIDASLRSPDAGPADAGDGGTSGTGSSGCVCAAVGLDRDGVVVADFGALVLGAGVLLRRRGMARRDR